MTRASLFSIVLAVGLAACSTKPSPQIQIQPIEVLIPVPISCNVEVAEPVYYDSPEALEAAPDLFEAMKLRIAGRGQVRDEVRELRAALEVCKGGGNATSTANPDGEVLEP